MKFELKKKHTKALGIGEDHHLAHVFSKKAHQELGDFVKAIILFGSVARGDQQFNNTSSPDIDILIVIDDLTIEITDDVTQSYRIIVQRLATETSTRLHITTMKLTNFWEYIRLGDPIAINILRDGISLYDTGFFRPTQELLYSGRIRPTKESIHQYFARAPLTLNNADWHVMQGALDLYWAVIDAASAALMSEGEVPPTPRHVPELLTQKLVKTKKLHKRHVKTVEELYELQKDITYKRVSHLRGADYDALKIKAEDFLKATSKLIKL